MLIVASTWEDGKPPASAQFFATWLAESAKDFRVGSLLLSRSEFCVFGVGSKAYGDSFNGVARDFGEQMRELGAKEMIGVCEGDVDGGDIDGVFDDWCERVVKYLKGGVFEANDGVECGDQSSEVDSDDVDSEIVDLEDIAGKAPSRKSVPVVETNSKFDGKKEMVTPVIRANLEKQVYLLPFVTFI